MHKRKIVATLAACFLVAILVCSWLFIQKRRADITRYKDDAKVFTLIAAGDVTFGHHYQRLFNEKLRKGTSEAEMLEYPFAEVLPTIKNADVAVVNLECPFTVRGQKLEKKFTFRATPRLAASLKLAGIDVVSLANNHLMDYGPEGVLDTIAALGESEIACFGAGTNLAHARQPAILERDGVTIGFLGYLFLPAETPEPKAVWATETAPGVAGSCGDIEQLLAMMQEDIKQTKSKADLVAIYFHFGKEGSHDVQEEQAKLAHAAVDAGANLVLGAHSHVLQGAELYKGAPIVYSLGNFVFGGSHTVKQSAIFKAQFREGKVSDTAFFPVSTGRPKERPPEAPFQPFFLEGDQQASLLRDLAIYSEKFPEPLVKRRD